MRVILVEDDARDIDLTRRVLACAAPHVSLRVATTLGEARTCLAECTEDAPCDLVLTDLNLPDGSGLQLVAEIRERSLPLAVVVLTGANAAETAVAALKAGADDFLLKRDDYLQRLPGVLEMALARFRADAARRARPLRVLYAEDSAIDIDLTRRHLARHAPNIRLEAVFGVPELLHRLPRTAAEPSPCDVLLLDYRLAGTDALEVLKTLRDERRLDLPVVLITGQDDGEVAAQAFRFGATDYLVKHPGYLFELPAVLEAAHDRAELVRERAVLRQSEQRYRELVATVPGAVYSFRVDAAGRRSMPFMSDGISSLIGLSAAEVMADVESAFRQIPADALPALEQSIHTALLEFSPWTHEFPVRATSGEEKWVRGQSRPRREADGSTVWHGVFVDITERKHVEDALRLLSTGMVHLSGEAFFREIASQVARLLGLEIGFVGLLLMNAERPCIRTLGLSVDGKFMPPVEYELARTPCESVIGKKTALYTQDIQRVFPEFRMLADLGVSGYAAVPLFNTKGDLLGDVGVMSRAPLQHPERVESMLRLFAVRTAAEIERTREQTRFQDLFEFSPDAVIMVNQKGLITLANRRAESLFGYTREEFMDLPVDDLVPQVARSSHAALRQQYFSNAVPRAMGARGTSLSARRKDGTIFPADISLSPMQSDEGTLVVATVRDISERMQAEAQRQALEAQLFQAQKMEAIGTLAGGIAHDFNNILSAIIGNVKLARQDVGPDHPALESLAEIGKASDGAKDLVRQILAFSRKQTPQRRAIALPPVIEEVVKLMRATLPAGIHLATAFSADAPKVKVLADPTQVHQVVMNLCTNAAQAMEGKPGRIDIRFERIEPDAMGARPAGLPPGRYVHVSVRDTGCGMDAATLERIFEPFYTTKAVGEGTGLGLSVVHGIMHAHEGAVSVDSRPGMGSTFHLYFPALEVAAPAEGAELELQAPASVAGRGQHVLYVDDDEALVFMVTRMLERQGYRVSGYTWAKEALDALRANPGGFDLVVTDYNMPGMSGLDLAREIHAIRADLPVALTSGYITDELRRKADESGVHNLIYKPNTVEELCETVRTLTSETRR